MTNWPHKSVCWSVGGNEYQIMMTGRANNKGIFKSKRVDITSFEPPSGGENRQITYTYTSKIIGFVLVGEGTV